MVQEKKPYLDDKVAELKAKYEKAMESYNATEEEEGYEKSNKEEATTEEVEELTDE